MKKVILFTVLAGMTLPVFSQLNLNNAVTPANLVNNILLGNGVTASNITYTGATIARSAFTTGALPTNLGLSDGILLSSGEAIAPTSPASYHHSTGLGTPGDAQLDAIVTPRVTYDACVLEFDFSVASDSVMFEYVFASEEYNDYSNTNFNDVFAFFISGPGIAGVQNIALIPGTATPVSINTINNGNSGGVATGPCMNCQYFVDNVGGSSVYFDGFTTVLAAKSAVLPCETYHIKLAISDAGDGVFDSGVFLKGGSFQSIGQISLFANGVAQSNGATVYACVGDSVELCLNPSTNYNWPTGATTQCIWVNQANLMPGGQYQAVVFGTAGCLAYTTTINVQFVTPTATITPSGPTNLCPGNTVTLTANPGNTYLWSNGATTQAITVGTAGTYTVTVTNGPNCSAVSAPVSVTIGSATATITGVTSLCNGASTTLSSNLGQTYLWSTGAVTQNISVSNPGTYTVTVTQVGGCTATASVNIQVNPNPAPAIAGSLSICQGTSTTLTATAGFTSYAWSTGATTVSISPNTSGPYAVTVTDANGCTGTTSVNLVVNPLPLPNIIGSTSICQGQSSTLNAGAGFSSYQWNTGATTQTISVAATGTYTVTVTNAAGCSASTNLAVTVNPLPTPVITGTFDFCQGASTVIDAGAGYSIYQWNTGAATQTIPVSAANTFTVTVTDANGCSNSTSQAITVNANPVPAIAGVLSICQGTSTTLTATAGFPTYLWSTGAGTSSINPSVSGPYAVTVTDANGCTGTTSVNLTVNPLPVPAITGTTSFCQGQNSTLNAGGGFASYLWNTGATAQTISVSTAGTYTVTVTNAATCSATTNTVVTVNPLPAPVITGTFDFCQGASSVIDAGAGFSNYLWNTGATTQSISVSSAGTFTVTVTDANGCSNSTSQAIAVYTNPVPAISGTLSICQGTSTTLTATPGFATYLWSTGAGTSSISPSVAGTYDVTVTDANGCTGTTSASLVVNALPVPAITGVTSFCQGAGSTLDAGGGFASYLWNTGATTQTLAVTAAGTYTVTVTNAFSCSGSANAVITVNPLPLPAITGPAAICAGNSAVLDAGAGYATYLWSDGSTAQTITTASSGNYTVTVTSAAGCTGSTSASLTVNPLPVPAITGVTTVCQGVTTVLDAGSGYASYSWSTGATTQTISTGAAGSVTVTVTDANGCSAPASTSVTVNPLPVPVITGTNAFCDGLSGTLDAGAGFTAYVWSTGATTQTINVANAGTYTVTVTATTGCQGDDLMLVTVHPNPVPVITGVTSICQGSSTTLDAGTGYTTYLWSDGSTNQTISVSTQSNFSVTVTSAFGCVGSTSVNTVVNALPVPSITGITEICQGATTTFDAGSGYAAYAWSSGSASQTISPGAAGTYTVTVTDANGCQNSTSISLTVNPLPAPVITGDFRFCMGDDSDIDAGAGFVSYLWSDGSTTQTINVNMAGNYTVTVTDNNGCSNNASASILVDPLPVPVISGDNTICQGTTTTFGAGNYVSYMWSDGSTAATLTTGTAGTYAVTVTDVNGCVGSTSETLVVYDLPTVAISGDNTICDGESTPVSVVFTGEAPFTCTYSNGSVTMPPLTFNNLSGTFNVSPGATTTYTLISISDANCTGIASGSVQVIVNPLPEPVISGDLSICDGETTTLSATPGFVSYNWSNNVTQPSFTTGTGGIYGVTVTDQNGCEGSTSVTLAVHMVPVVAFTNDTSITCEVPRVNFTNLSLYDPGSAFSWTFGDGGTSSAANPAHIYVSPGSYPVSLEITTPYGCSSSASQPVSVVFFPLPVADFITAPDAANVFNAKVAFVDRSDYAVTWFWEFGDGKTSIEQNPIHYYNEVGDYKVALTVTNIAGCLDRFEDVVPINPFYIPNAFTPNGDGINDVFYYSGYNLDVSSYKMNIFNRWGQLVFSGENENMTWSGEATDGQPAPAGTYVYRLQITTLGGKEHTFEGQVNLVR